MCFYDLYPDGIPVPMVTYTRRELFAEHWCDKGGGEGLEAVNPPFENLYPKWTNHSTAG